MLDYWHEWPPAAELLKGFVGYKPVSKDEQKKRNKAMTQSELRHFGPTVGYEQLPEWLREAHKQTEPST